MCSLALLKLCLEYCPFKVDSVSNDCADIIDLLDKEEIEEGFREYGQIASAGLEVTCIMGLQGVYG